MVAPILYEQGTKFGKWTVLNEGPSSSQGKTWLCKCECGFERNVLGTRLRSGKSNSCGCDSIKATQQALWKGHGDISLTLFNSYKKGAANRNLIFDITIEQAWNLFLQQNKRCALTGLSLEMFSYVDHYDYCAKGSKGGITGKRSHGTASLDRIDSNKGYTISNIQWIHKDINRMKMNMDQDYFLKLCKQIVDHLSN